MSTLKVNSITPTSGTDVTVGGNLQLGNKNVTTTGIVSTSQVATTGDVSFGGNADFNSNSLTEVANITGTGTLSGFGAVNGTNMTATGVVTAGACTLTASSGAIACTSLAIDGVAVSTSAPLKAFGRITVDTASDPHTAVVQTGDLNLGTATITAAGAGTPVITVPFTEALSGTDYVVMTTTTISDGFALPGTRGTSNFEMTVTDAKTYDIQIMVLSV